MGVRDDEPTTPRTSLSPSIDVSVQRSGPITRSAAKRLSSQQAPVADNAANSKAGHEYSSGKPSPPSRRRQGASKATGRGSVNGESKQAAPKSDDLPEHQPMQNGQSGSSNSLFEVLSRSSSPKGLIPLHQHYHNLIHRHEIPRKALHVSIGFVTLYLYTRGIQASAIPPFLISALVPIATIDVLRHHFPSMNQLYIRLLGALMREAEVSGYNGVIWYLLGTSIVLSCFPKDVGVMGVLLLSWCDTAASTSGRLWGRYTPHLRRGKSLAGTLAAWLTGAVTAAVFWGYFVPAIGPFADDPPDAFMFTGRLHVVPASLRNHLGWAGVTPAMANAVVAGPLALVAMSVWTGFAAAISELADPFGWDDNLTIPVLSGIGLWVFLKAFAV